MQKKIHKKSCGGFTLVEVIVAMMLLGISAVVLVGMYGSVALRLRNNNEINDRMSEQQKYVESKQQTNPVTNSKLFNVAADSKLSSSVPLTGADFSSDIHFEIKCTYNKANTSWVASGAEKNFYSNCAIYTLKNLENGEPVASDDDDMKVDYKYFVGDNTMQ